MWPVNCSWWLVSSVTLCDQIITMAILSNPEWERAGNHDNSTVERLGTSNFLHFTPSSQLVLIAPVTSSTNICRYSLLEQLLSLYSTAGRMICHFLGIKSNSMMPEKLAYWQLRISPVISSVTSLGSRLVLPKTELTNSRGPFKTEVLTSYLSVFLLYSSAWWYPARGGAVS